MLSTKLAENPEFKWSLRSRKGYCSVLIILAEPRRPKQQQRRHDGAENLGSVHPGAESRCRGSDPSIRDDEQRPSPPEAGVRPQKRSRQESPTAGEGSDNEHQPIIVDEQDDQQDGGGVVSPGNTRSSRTQHDADGTQQQQRPESPEPAARPKTYAQAVTPPPVTDTDSDSEQFQTVKSKGERRREQHQREQYQHEQQQREEEQQRKQQQQVRRSNVQHERQSETRTQTPVQPPSQPPEKPPERPQAPQASQDRKDRQECGCYRELIDYNVPRHSSDTDPKYQGTQTIDQNLAVFKCENTSDHQIMLQYWFVYKGQSVELRQKRCHPGSPNIVVTNRSNSIPPARISSKCTIINNDSATPIDRFWCEVMCSLVNRKLDERGEKGYWKFPIDASQQQKNK